MNKPLLSIICAVGRNRVIGIQGRLPWHLPADLANFKRLTLGKVVVMGRKTYQSIGRPLPKRENVVLTRQPDYKPEHPGITVLHELQDVLDKYSHEQEIMFIGGAQLFQEVLPLADRQYLSLIQAEFEGDTFYPLFDPWEWIIKEHTHYSTSSTSTYPWDFLHLERTPSVFQT